MGFVDYLNNTNTMNMRYTSKFSDTQVEFLDVLVSLKNGALVFISISC